MVLHYTGMASGAAALARLRDPAAEVSCHYLVWEDGGIDQLVAEADRAWHAGRASWASETNINAVSIGIEIVNGGHDFGCPPYLDVQVAAVVRLVGDLRARHAIPPARVLGHSDVAPKRKRDPGEHFPWSALAQAGCALSRPASSAIGHPASEAVDVVRLLRTIGYAVSDDAADLPDVLRAFQRRWRPDRITGQADSETIMLLRDIATLMPVR